MENEKIGPNTVLGNYHLKNSSRYILKVEATLKKNT